MTPDRIVIHLRKVSPAKGSTVTLYGVGYDDKEVAPPMGTWALDDFKRDELPDLADELFKTAQFDCDEAGHPKKYRAIATSSKGDECKRWTMSQTPDPAAQAPEQGQGLQLEEPSMAGFVAMNMRHTERALDMMLQGNDRTIKNLLAQNEALTKRCAQLEKQIIDTTDLARQVYMQAGSEVESERSAERIDNAMALVAKVASAAGVQLGFLPEGFDPLSDDMSKLTQNKLAAPTEAKATETPKAIKAPDPTAE